LQQPAALDVEQVGSNGNTGNPQNSKGLDFRYLHTAKVKLAEAGKYPVDSSSHRRWSAAELKDLQLTRQKKEM
jgi:hypothetical protein